MIHKLPQSKIDENISLFTDEELKSFLIDELIKLAWTYAKTMPTCPHEYIVRGKTASEEIYMKLFETIEKYGVVEYFYKTPRKYLYLGDGYKYWHMCGDMNAELGTKYTIDDSRVINRAVQENIYDNRER